MSDIVYLALHFDAPLQSWGHQSKFDRRTTLPFPTRSGVIGLLCAALGVDRTDMIGLGRLETLDVSVFVLRQGGHLTDYHTVGGGYDAKRDRQRICRRAGGGVGDTVQTWRDYLEAARFGVVVAGPRLLLNDLATSVCNPKWGIWLGRKACIPASRLCEGIFDSEATALAQLCAAAGIERPLRCVREVESFAEGTDTLMDRPIDFAARSFASRRVAIGPSQD